MDKQENHKERYYLEMRDLWDEFEKNHHTITKAGAARARRNITGLKKSVTNYTVESMRYDGYMMGGPGPTGVSSREYAIKMLLHYFLELHNITIEDDIFNSPSNLDNVKELIRELKIKDLLNE